MQDDGNINVGMQEKNTLAGAGFAHFDRRCRIALKLKVGCGMKNRKSQVKEVLHRDLQLSPGQIRINIPTGVGWQD